ncbi:MAG: hypothetical protein J6334_00250 [Kiritimatiellae bacterium]|nr:hypothetical protein [Kiritimatiellia bacterium]
MKRLMMAVAAAVAGVTVGYADVQLATPFGDGMVLQRDRAVPVWGKAAPGEKIKVTFAGQSREAVAAADGAWQVTLDPMAASKENRELTVAGANTVTVKNVLVGEVWFASGQSNMECPIWGNNPRYRDGKGAMMIRSTVRPYIRWAKNPKAWSATPKPLANAVWRDYSPASFDEKNGMFLSAVAYYYALELYGALEIPIGIIDSSWGGTNIDAWTPRCGYENHPELKDVADYPVTANWDKAQRRGPVSGSNQQPTVLWNGMVDAWTPFAIRGFIWYQGCHNNGEARRYCSKMHALYDGWAKAFRNPDLKLYFVELAPYSASWFELQRSQMRFAAEEKNAAIAVTCDAGNIHDIHPNDKEIVAKRLALHALKRDYGFDAIRDNAPTLKEWRIEGNAFVLTFNDAEGWYVYSADRSVTPSFEIAGKDNKFFPAKLLNVNRDGNVKGKELRIAADNVQEPVRLRYLAKSPYTGTLYSDASLPLGPFDIETRTQTVKRIGAPVKLGGAEQIPELAGFRKVLAIDVPAMANFDTVPPAYTLDKTAEAGDFSRIAYLLEIEQFDGQVDWAMTAMDAFTKQAGEIGIPCVANRKFQTKVNALTVRSNIEGIKAVTDFDGGNIEFWPCNYGQRAAVEGIGGASDAYDFNDEANDPSKIGYGSMQVHNWKDGQTVWVLNNFNHGEAVDVGIGNNEMNGNPDWTFMRNGYDFKTRRLSVFVK